MHIADLDVTTLERRRQEAFLLDISPRTEGGWWQLPLLTATGAEPGPTLVVLAGVHGDEYEGVEAIHRIAAKASPTDLRGTLLMVPVCNVAAYATATRNSPVDSLNLARVFPGSESGTLTQQIAHWLTVNLFSAADFLIDLHSAGVVGDIPTLAGYVHSNDSVGRRSLAAARFFGAPVLWGHPPPVPPGRTLSAALDLGVPCLYTEAPGAGRARPQDVDCFTRGVLNVMRHLDMLEEEPESSPPPLHLLGDGNMDEVMSAPAPGYFRARVELLEEVQAGQLVGTIHDPLGDSLAELHAEKDGIVIMRRGLHRVHSGDGLIHLTGRAEESYTATTPSIVKEQLTTGN